MKKFFKVFAFVFFLSFLDQLSKGIILYLILGYVPITGYALTLIPFSHMYYKVSSFFNIVFTWNPGTAFSLFKHLGVNFQNIIIFIISFIIGFLFHYLFTKSKKEEKIPLIFILGGSIGNLIDRIRFGMVIDFLDFHINSLHWPAFNLADSFIVLGILIYIVNMLINKKVKI